MDEPSYLFGCEVNALGMYRWLILSLSAYLIAHWTYLYVQGASPPDWGQYEVDRTGQNSPRLILNKPGLNAFDFSADGLLYSPVQFTGEIIKINVDTGAIARVASGLTSPTAVKFNSKGELFALDAATGQVVKVDLATGQTRAIAQLQTGLDNLAFGPTDLLYASNFVDSDINEVNTQTGRVRKVVDSGG